MNKKTFINIKTAEGVETIEEFNRDEYNSSKEYRDEVNNTLTEYHRNKNFIGAYLSTRCTKEWRS